MVKFFFAVLIANLAARSRAGFLTHVSVRDPTYEDFEEITSLIHQTIEESTCEAPAEGEQANWNGWDENENDCILFKAERNPNALATRLIRHAFHDATGKSDGFIDHGNPEHSGLMSSQIILDALYESEVFASDGVMVKDVLSKADFFAWAYIAGVSFGCTRQKDADTDHCPVIPVRYGRQTFELDENDPDDVFTPEEFPEGTHVPNAHADKIVDYFAARWGFSEDDAAVIMGAHTLGGARRTESGYTGMWTQSKNAFNNDYYHNLLDPIPLDCSLSKTSDDAAGMGGCVILNDPAVDRCDDVHHETGAAVGDRCGGWEQVPIIFNGARKFQWRHSCFASGDNCTHIMLNVDMSLLRDIDDHLCTQQDEITMGSGVNGCREGKIKSFPTTLPADAHPDCGQPDLVSNEIRFYASCFPLRTDLGTATAIENYAESANEMTFLDRFANLYDILISTVDGGRDSLTLIETPPEGTIANGDVCPMGDEFCVMGSENPFDCAQCISGKCAEIGGSAICKPQSWTYPTGVLNGEPCPNMDVVGEGCVRPAGAETWTCIGCKSTICGQRGTGEAQCRHPNWGTN